MFIPTPNAARVAVSYTLFTTTPVINTLWFTKSTPFSGADLALLTDELATQWGGFVMPYLDSNLEMVALYAIAQDSDTSPTYSDVLGSPVAGGYTAGAACPANAALAVSFYTAARGRSGRGRVYLAGLRTTMLFDIDRITDTIAGNIGSAVAGAMAGMATAGYTHVVVSHYHDKVALSAGVARPVTRWYCNPRVDTMRNRLGA